jgi:transposase
MNRIPKGSYAKEFREQAVKPVVVDGLSQREAAGRLSMSVKTLGAWVVAERKGTRASVGETQKPLSALEAELARVKRELAIVTVERDILKNIPQGRAPVRMGRNSGPGGYTERCRRERPFAFW